MTDFTLVNFDAIRPMFNERAEALPEHMTEGILLCPSILMTLNDAVTEAVQWALRITHLGNPALAIQIGPTGWDSDQAPTADVLMRDARVLAIDVSLKPHLTEHPTLDRFAPHLMQSGHILQGVAEVPRLETKVHVRDIK